MNMRFTKPSFTFDRTLNFVPEIPHFTLLKRLPPGDRCYGERVVVVSDVWSGKRLKISACLVGRVIESKSSWWLDEKEGETYVDFGGIRRVVSVPLHALRLDR